MSQLDDSETPSSPEIEDNSPFSSVSTEVFDLILTHITETRELNNLSQTCHSLYHRTIPKLYYSYSYHGLSHSIKSLQLFLRTVDFRPDLASHVRVLDIREWRSEWGQKCVRLEDHIGDRSGRSPTPEIDERKVDQEAREKLLETEENWGEDNSSDEDYECSNRGSSPSNSSCDGEEEEDQTCKLEDEIDISLFAGYEPDKCTACHGEFSNKDIDFLLQYDARKQQLWMEKSYSNYRASMFEKKDNILLWLLIPLLPEIRILKMVVPEYGDMHQIFPPLAKAAGKKDSTVLKKLEELWYISTLRIAPKGHREYEFELEELYPFLSLPNLKTLYTVHPRTFNDSANFDPPSMTSLINNSSLKHLNISHSSTFFGDTLSFLSIPKALISLTWSQKSANYGYTDICYEKLCSHKLLPAMEKHKETLKKLDLDLRMPICSQIEGQIIDREPIQYGGGGRGKIWNPKSPILRDSLRDFKVLEKICIDEASLCNQETRRMEDILPGSVKLLNIRILAYKIKEGGIRFENDGLVGALRGLLGEGWGKVKGLRRIGVWVVDPRSDEYWVGDEPAVAEEARETGRFDEVEMLCTERGVEFEIVDEVFGTKEEYFVEQMKDWEWGRDW